MFTPPLTPQITRAHRRSAKPKTDLPVCPTCLCGLFHLIQSANKASRRTPALDEKLDALTRKIDLIAEKIALGEARDENSSLRALDDADQIGIEVARYSQVPQFDASILDTYIPECRRMTQLHFGHIVSNPHAPMAFKEKMGYNMTYNLVPPGHGNALHMHRSIEIFVALDGHWQISWGMEGEHSVVLQPWDFVAVPARVCHSYKNIERQTGQNIMTILPGKSWITWAPNVVANARARGADCDDNGVMSKYAHLVAPEDCGSLGSTAGAVEWKHLGPDDMSPFLHRFEDRRAFTCHMSGPDDQAAFIEMSWKTVPAGSHSPLPRREGVDLLIVILDGSVLIQSRNGRPIAAAGKLDAVCVPCQALEAGEVIISNLCPTDGTLLLVATQMREHNDLYFHLC